MARTAFISHASEDATVASTISEYLERNGVSCWIAPRDVRPGADYGAEIIEGIETSAVFVLVLSEHANASEFVYREVERAVSKGKPVFPVRVREVTPSKSLELFVSSAEWIDAWTPPIEQYLGRLAESIRSAESVYSPGGYAQPTNASPPHVSAGSGAGPSQPVVRDRPGNLRAVVMVLVAAVIVLSALLLWSMFRTRAVPASSAGGTGPASGLEPPTATAPVPERPAPVGAAPASAALAGTDPCPRSLAINRDLPTPFTCTCSQQATAEAAVWGTDVYTDDSALCRAALHAGVISPQGGSITVIRSAGRPLYVGSRRNGVESSDFPAYPSSIEFKGTPPLPPGPGLCPRYLAINRDLPTPFTCRCSGEATQTGAVWGTDVYTDDSSMCRAAIHAGRIPLTGGTITVMRSEGRALYVGTTRNGVQSSDYGASPASITFR